MKRIHVALSVDDLAASIRDYTLRLEAEPTVVIGDEYALWRTPHINLSLRRDGSASGALRHLGWEDSEALEFSAEEDVNGILWERFSADAQDAEIEENWPGSISRKTGTAER